MQILLACAQNMTTRPELSPSILTKPKFLEEAERHALQLAAFTEAELGKALKCTPGYPEQTTLSVFFRFRRQRACRVVIQRHSLSPPPRLGIYRSRLCLRQQPSVDLLLFIWPAPAYGPDQKLPFRG